ncbi:MAG: hypothetical protein JXA95_07720 [Spirochaetales bacterium]|nr:hypothetical protein [Spirochaetales bacterium]
MIWFLIKKSFWDYWDRMGLMLLFNLLLLGAAALCFYIPWLLVQANQPFLSVLSLIVFGALFFLVLGANSRMCSEIAYFRSLYFRNYWTFMKEKAAKTLFFYLVIVALSFIVYTALSFYGNAGGNLISLAAFFFIFWIAILLLFSAGYYFPLSNIMDDPFKKNLKKCFILFFDNPGASIAVSLLSLILFAVSLVSALIIPGISAIAILWENLLKFLMLKYDYLEENSEANRKKIPWDVVLRDERETIGTRTLGDMIRPWK